MSNEGMFDDAILQGFLEETKDALAAIDPLFVDLEKDPYNTDIINAIFRPVHSIKGNAPFFGLMKLKVIAHDFESLLAALRERKVSASRDLFDLLLRGVDEIKAVVTRLQNKQPEVLDERAFAQLIEQARHALKGGAGSDAASWGVVTSILDAIKKGQLTEDQKARFLEFEHAIYAMQKGTGGAQTGGDTSTAPVKESSTPNTASVQASPSGAPKGEANKSMRVSEERIDTFLKFVGELVIAQDMLRHFSTKLQTQNIDRKLRQEFGIIHSTITGLGNGLEKAIMSIRKVSVRTLLQKVPRLVRDVAAAKNKEVEVVVLGDEIEIDKSLVELLDAPLTHMSRNAADHGIEMPEIREKAGKSRKGTVHVRCSEGPKEICIEIADDGGGLNYEGLKKKAITLGLLQPGQPLTEDQVVNLIFMAGVSTATEVSDISGRGVGMDVVKRNIELAGGSITVSNSPGKGCSFLLRLPKTVTTQIMQGFVIEVAGNHYVVPLERVQESWSLTRKEITQVIPKGECIVRHDHVIPLVDLCEVFGEKSEYSSREENNAVTVNIAKKEVAFYVDNVIGPRQVVLKPLEGLRTQSKLFLGGAVLGDGQVALVLDLPNIVQ